MNICKNTPKKCNDKEYPAILETAWGRDINQKTKQNMCYPISGTLESQNVQLKLIGNPIIPILNID